MLVIIWMRMKFLRNAAIIMLIMLGICFVSISLVYKVNTDPIDAKSTDKMEVVIPANSSVKKVGEILKENGLIQKYKESEIASDENNYEDKENNHKEFSSNKDLCKEISASLPDSKEGEGEEKW